MMDKILLGHGSGGALMHELINDHFAPAFGISGNGDSAILDISSRKLAYTTDSYVVFPLFFPGGNIGDLAVNGTVNDLAVSGAEPLFLTAGFIVEEGFPVADLTSIVASMSSAAERAGVKIVAGDTKVVDRGKADGIFINTSGVGILPDGRMLSPTKIKNGDSIIISGEIGNHGVAVIAERNGLTFDPPVITDSRPLNGLTRAMFEKTSAIRFMRDPTRGGVATTLKEAALESGRCLRIFEKALPIPDGVKGACSLLGFDPLYVANEGILIAVVDPSVSQPLVEIMKEYHHGSHAAIIGTVEESPQGMVLLDTVIGGSRIIDMLRGEQLPRIC